MDVIGGTGPGRNEVGDGGRGKRERRGRDRERGYRVVGN